MGFAEALADDGKLSGRATPLLRGLVCGLMTIAGHRSYAAVPNPNFYIATAVAAVIELLVMAWIRWRFMVTPRLPAGTKVMLGGAQVLAAGIAIGGA
jgi:hypothetical protein